MWQVRVQGDVVYDGNLANCIEYRANMVIFDGYEREEVKIFSTEMEIEL